MLQNPSTKYRAFAPVRLTDRTWPDAVITKPPVWCSVDLRDGNQALIEPMDIERKVRMFEQLVKIGFKEIEVGFPSASQIEFDFMRKLIEENRIPDDVTVQVLTQAREHLIRRTFEALEGVPRAIVHLYNATAPVMRRVVLNMSEDEIVEPGGDQCADVQGHCGPAPQTKWTFQYSPEMYSDTEAGVLQARDRRRHRCLAAHAREQVHHQSAHHRGAFHAQYLCRHGGVDASQHQAPRQRGDLGPSA